MNKNVLGIITARGGSKSIPKKNIKLLGGKPLLAYTIEAAKASRLLDRVIMSTEDEDIAEIARKYNCEVPFMRPKELAQDCSLHIDVIIHAVNWLIKNENYYPDYVMILQPTTPLRQSFHIDGAIEKMFKTGSDSVIAVIKVPENYNPERSLFKLNDDNKLVLYNGKPLYERISRRQDVRPCFRNTGIIYAFKTKLLFNKNPNFFGKYTAPYIIEEKYDVDINEPKDWKIAEDKIKSKL